MTKRRFFLKKIQSFSSWNRTCDVKLLERREKKCRQKTNNLTLWLIKQHLYGVFPRLTSILTWRQKEKSRTSEKSRAGAHLSGNGDEREMRKRLPLPCTRMTRKRQSGAKKCLTGLFCLRHTTSNGTVARLKILFSFISSLLAASRNCLAPLFLLFLVSDA